MKYQLNRGTDCPWILRRGADRLIHCTEGVHAKWPTEYGHLIHSAWENGKLIAWTEYAPGAYEIGARKMSDPQPTKTGGSATSDVMRNIATFLDALTTAGEETGVRLLDTSFVEVEVEGVTVGISWSAADEAYVAEIH